MSDLFSNIPNAPAEPPKVVALRDSYITVEATERGSFWGQRVRGNGATAGVLYTRDELDGGGGASR